MSNLGSRYASALLSIALDEKKNAEYREYIKNIYSIIEEEDSLSKLLICANLTKDEKKDVIDKVFKDCPYESIRNFFKVIIDNSRGNNIKEILQDFISLSNAKDDIVEGYIYTASKYTASQIEEISSAIAKRIKKKVYLKQRIDDELIGGFKVVINDYVFDTTIKNKIEELKSNLLERR